MLTEFRAAVRDVLAVAFAPTLDVFDRVPDDVNVLPCLVVGYPSATPAAETNVFEIESTVYVIARRPDVDDAEGELVALADAVSDQLGGTRGRKSTDGARYLTVESIAHRVVSIAGLDHDAYLFTVSSPVTTC